MRNFLTLFLIYLTGCLTSAAAQVPADSMAGVKRNLYVVGVSHLDTQWRWTIQNTINEYIPATFRDNLKLMNLFPDYTFSFEGAFKYMLLKEYYRDEFERLKPFVASGRWRLAGSWVDAVDVNIPSFESLVRQTLYGNGFFQSEFGKTSRDVLLPDCFGFGYALPSIASHCGLKSFSTQKLSWGSSVGIPFDIGIWQGVDGRGLVAALDPGSYVTQIRDDLSRDTTWLAKIERQGERSGLYADYMYFGTGDTGGSPDSESVAWLEKSLNGDGPIEVKSIGSDDLVDLVPSDTGIHLPLYNGELLMTRHGVGCYTSQTAMKRWNRMNENLADAAERASVIAHLLGGQTYPRQALRETWTRFLWHQFHDDLTGTSIPEAYQFSWNDEVLCMNRFSGMLEAAAGAVGAALDTRGKGVPLIVYNPLSMWREEVVEATIAVAGLKWENLRVYDFDGKEVPSQIVSISPGSVHFLFLGAVPPIGFAVFDVRPAKSPGVAISRLHVSDRSLENSRYKVELDDNGDVRSIFDNENNRELLAAPIGLQFLHDKPDRWPAWEITYDDIQSDPITDLIDSVRIETIESGPVRVKVAVTRWTANSIFRSFISLTAGDDGAWVRFDNVFDWYERELMLKAAFKLTTPNDSAKYDIGLGAIKRGINTPKLYEVPGQKWADLASYDGSYGVSILNDCKYGWDHPDSSTLRLTLIHTPGVSESWNWVGDQKSQDNGHHQFGYGVMAHKADRKNIPLEAARFNQRLIAFETTSHKGSLGKSFSFAQLRTLSDVPDRASETRPSDQLLVDCVKMAESGDEVVIRLHETQGKPLNNAIIEFAWPVISAREINGAEDSIGNADIQSGQLVASFAPFQPRSFALRLDLSRVKPLSKPVCTPVKLAYDLDGISFDSNRGDGDFDGEGNTLSGDLIGNSLSWGDIPFALGPMRDGAANVLACRGQKLSLRHDVANRLYMLMTATGGPAEANLVIGDSVVTTWIQDYAMPLGQWNSRLVGDAFVEDRDLIAPAYINREPVVWAGSHRHNAKGEDEAYRFTYVYLASMNLPSDATELTLPNNPRIKLLAATLVKTALDNVRAAQPLYDYTNSTLCNIQAKRHAFIDSALVSISCPTPGARVHYTIDGSDPAPESPYYASPFYVTGSATVKSRAFLEGWDDTYVAQAKFNRLTLREAVQVGELAPGLKCAYFEGHWSKLPPFDSLIAVKDTIAASVTIPELARKEDFGLIFTGYIRIMQDGLYRFSLSSDDGSTLTIGDSLTIDNDGLHGEGEIIGEIALKSGYHSIAVRMFQASGDVALSLAIDGPGIEKKPVSADMLFHSVKVIKKGR